MSQPRLAIVGAGILGLAHALAAARRGYQVSVFERDAMALGASVRNFGLGLSLGQPQGELYELAQASRQQWLALLPQLGSWHKAKGSVMLARTQAELAVLHAFQDQHGRDYATSLLNRAALAELPVQGLGALFSPSEIALDARHAIPALARYLASEYAVRFHFNTQVNAISLPQLHTSAGVFETDQAIICSGHDVQTLYPEAYAPLGIRRCALQMLKLANPGITLAPSLLTSLSALRYPAFSQSPALAQPLAALKAEVEQQQPALLAHGIHLIVQQLGERGELIVGDSHHYGSSVSPFQAAEVENLLLQLAGEVLQTPLTVLERWQGVYASGSRSYYALQPADGVRAVVMGAGIGMSIAFALAERQLAA